MNPIEIEVTAEYRTQAPLGFCHIHDMGGSMITLRARPSDERRALNDSSESVTISVY